MKILKFLKTHCILTAFLLCVGLPASMNYSGFCFAEGRYLSDEERIRLYLELSMRNTYRYQERGSIKDYEYIKYSSVDEFLEKNPDCCGVNIKKGYDLAPPRFLDRITGFNSGKIISIEFPAYKLSNNGKKKLVKDEFYHYQMNCGKAQSY